MDNQLQKTPQPLEIAKWVWTGSAICLVVGLIGLAAAFQTSPTDAWVWLLVWFVVFWGLANGALLWAAVFRMTQTRWSGAVNRLAHSILPFSGLLWVVMIVLLLGARHWVVWLDHPIPEKAAWLNVPFMIARDIVCVGLLWILCFLLVRWSLAVDAGVADGKEVSAKQHYRLTAIATASVLAYVLAGTIVSYDFVMSLAPEWASTMFAPYFWITSLYSGMAVLIIMAAAFRRQSGIDQHLRPQQFHDLGNLLLGFSLFSMGLFFAQYLTIWYENLPEESFFIILRYGSGIWQVAGWAAFIVGYAVPFILLQSVGLKKNPLLSSLVAGVVVVGIGLERYVLIVPSLAPDKLMLHPLGLLGLLAFAGAFVFSACVFPARYQPVSAADVALKESEVKLEVLS